MFSVNRMIELGVFLAFFLISFYAFSCIKFETFCKTVPAQKIYLLLFLLCLCTAWIATWAILSLTIYGGLL